MKRKINKDYLILVGLGTIIVAFFLYWVITSLVKRESQTNDFIEREIGGILENVKYDGRAEYSLTIRQHKTGEKLKYYLFLSPFIKENNIQTNDSISKEANGHTINFYKKKNGTFYKCCDLYYH
jgi:hypothetical protein